MKKGLATIAFILLWAAMVTPGEPAKAKQKRPHREIRVYFANTPDELSVYRVFGSRSGKTLMIIGGIQGDEPVGFLSADLYADISLAKGNLIVVPRANFYSIILNHRGPDGDMNRQFGDPVTARRQKKIIKILKGLIQESDLLLNLHDGSGFFRKRYEGPMANPRRYGQSLIADAARYHPPEGGVIDLEGMAEQVLALVNRQIDNSRYHLLFNNHRTAEKTSRHKEQRLSATFYALTQCHVPAFGVETSKSLPSTAMKVRHHLLVINAFMHVLGITPESPGINLQKPLCKFLVVSINGDLPVMAPNQGILRVKRGDRLKVIHVEANYERGLTVDILKTGSINDLRQEITLHKSTSIVVRKDNQRIGTVRIEVVKGERGFTTIRSQILYFVTEVEGERRLVANGERLRLVQGDHINLVDLLSNRPIQSGLKVNFKGFVPKNAGPNAGEDRGYRIDSARDLMRRYSKCAQGAPPLASCYQVVATQRGKVLGRMTVEVTPAKLDYLVLRGRDGHKLVFHHGDTVETLPGDKIEVVDLKSNVRPAETLDLALDQMGRRMPLTGRIIDMSSQDLRSLAKPGTSSLKLVVSRAGKDIGHVSLQIGGR